MSERAGESLAALVVLEVDRRTAHAGDRAGVLEVGAAEADEQNVVLRVEVLEDREHLDLETVDLRPLEDRQAVPLHAGADLGDLHVPVGVEQIG
jgi:hypothetical protein